MSNKIIYALVIFIAGSSYGFIVPVVKTARFLGVDVNDFLPLQYLIAFIVMGVASAISWRKVAHPGKADYAKMLLLGVFTSCTSLCYYRSVALLPGSVALTMLFQFVWIGPLIDALVSKKLPGKSTVLAIAIVLVGTVLAAGLLEEDAAELDTAGIGFGLLSALFYSLFLFFSGRIGTQYSVPVRTSMLSLGGLVVTSCVSPGALAYATTNPTVLYFALLMSAIGVIVPTGLISYASPKLPASAVSIMASSELPVGVLAAWAIIGEQPSAPGVLGIVIILCGIVLNQLPTLYNKPASAIRQDDPDR